MNAAPSKKKTYIVIILTVLAIGAYFYVTGDKPASTGLISAENNPEVAQISGRVLALLNQIQSLKVDSKFFQSAAYRTLVDYSIAIPPQNVGRPNPFAPIPGAARSTGSTGTRTR